MLCCVPRSLTFDWSSLGDILKHTTGLFLFGFAPNFHFLFVFGTWPKCRKYLFYSLDRALSENKRNSFISTQICKVLEDLPGIYTRRRSLTSNSFDLAGKGMLEVYVEVKQIQNKVFHFKKVPMVFILWNGLHRKVTISLSPESHSSRLNIFPKDKLSLTESLNLMFSGKVSIVCIMPDWGRVIAQVTSAPSLQW